MSAPDDNARTQFDEMVSDETKSLADIYWDVRDLYRERRTREELDSLYHHAHFIPVRHGWTRTYVEENYPGWSWNQLVTVGTAAGVFVGRGGSPAKCNDEVEEFYFDSETAWLVVWSDGHKTCGDDAPGVTAPAPTGQELPIFDLTTGQVLEQPSGIVDEQRSSSAEGPDVGEASDEEPMVEIFPGFLPWKIRPRHQGCAILDRFRTVLKQTRGEPTTDEEERRLRVWLDALEMFDFVVAYDPDRGPNVAPFAGGFHYVPRRPEDTWIIRDPELD